MTTPHKASEAAEIEKRIKEMAIAKFSPTDRGDYEKIANFIDGARIGISLEREKSAKLVRCLKDIIEIEGIVNDGQPNSVLQEDCMKALEEYEK